MTPEQFCYWFQGFCELSPCPPNDAQWQSIREHLQTVFKKVTPVLTDDEIRRAADKYRQQHGGIVSPSVIQNPWIKPLEVTC